MANPIYDATNNKPQNYNIIQQYNSFRNDPFTFLLRTKGIDIPREYRNDPQAAVQYLMNTGNLTQKDIDMIKNLANRMGVQIPV